MKQVMTVQTLGPQLIALLGMPKHVRSFELRCAVDEIVTVNCEYHPKDALGFDTILAEYELVPRQTANKAAPLHFDAWMRERTNEQHAAYMSRHSAGGIAYQ
jgi:hypothetical protein